MFPRSQGNKIHNGEDVFEIPGHHFTNFDYKEENSSLPDFRKYNWFGPMVGLGISVTGVKLFVIKITYQYFGMLRGE
jgi:hypothetical protein